jgi:hypothetical protein
VLKGALPWLGLMLVGCLNFGKTDDAKAPGDMLGVYDVSGTLQQSTCGAGALGSTPTWDFEVKLTRFENDIYWLNGAQTIPGDIASDGVTFSITSSVEEQISAPEGAELGCTVIRNDDAEGKLSDSGTDVESFDGTLSFDYETLTGSDCSSWVGTMGAVEVLPCQMSYDLTGERSAEKSPPLTSTKN